MDRKQWLSLKNKPIQLLDSDGKSKGYLPAIEAWRMGYKIETQEPSPKLTNDPYLTYHSDVAYEGGHLTGGNDLNSVQVALLASHIYRTKQKESIDAEQRFKEQIYLSLESPEKLYEYLMGEQFNSDKPHTTVEDDGMVVEWKAPSSLEEAMELIGELADIPDDVPEVGSKPRDVWVSSDLTEGMTD